MNDMDRNDMDRNTKYISLILLLFFIIILGVKIILEVDSTN